MRIKAKLRASDMILHASMNAQVSAINSGFELGNGLLWDDVGRLAVDVATDAEADNTRPISAAAVFAEVGNIDILLKTI